MAANAGTTADLGATTVDQEEIAQFGRIAADWWDPDGLFKPLHQMNPLRIGYIRDRVVAHFDRDEASTTPLSGLSAIVDVGCGGGLAQRAYPSAGRPCDRDRRGSSEGVDIARSHAKTRRSRYRLPG